MIKKIFCDVDGTLCTPQGNLSELTIEKIKAADAAGIEFIICTGRAFSGLKRPFEQYGSPLPSIVNMGSEYYGRNGELVFDFPFNKDEIRAIYHVAQTHENCGLVGFSSLMQFCTLPTKSFLKNTFGVDVLDPNSAIIDWFPDLREVKGVEGYFDYPIYKLECSTYTTQQAKAIMDALSLIDGIDPCLSEPRNIEITRKGVSKGQAMRFLCNRDHVSLDEVVSIGDSFNDLSMLANMKHSVAMGNAQDGLKKQCAHITDDNSHDGVAKIIDRILNGEIQ